MAKSEAAQYLQRVERTKLSAGHVPQLLATEWNSDFVLHENHCDIKLTLRLSLVNFVVRVRVPASQLPSLQGRSSQPR